VWPLLCLSASSVGWAVLAPAPGAAVRVAVTQLGWAAAAAAGVASRHGGAPISATSWAAACAALALPMVWPSLRDQGGTLGNPTLLAGALASVLGGLALSVWPRGGLRLLCGLAALFGVAALAVAESLGAVVALLAVAGVKLGQLPRRWWLTLLLLPAAAVLAAKPLREHLAGRLQLWDLAAGVVGDHPFGVGPGAFSRHFVEHQAAAWEAGQMDRNLWTLASHAHNEWLQVLTEQGVLGLSFCLLAFLPLARRRKTEEPSWAARGALAAGAVFAWVSTPWYEPVSAFVFWFAVGGLGAEWRKSEPAVASEGGVGGALGRVRSATGPVAARALVVSALLAVGLASSELFASRLTVLAARTNDPRGLQLAAAVALRPAPALRALADRLLPEHATRARLAAERAAELDPTPGAWLLIGRASMAALEPARAADAYATSVRLNPRLFAGWVGLAHAAHACRAFELSLQARNRAAALRPNDPALRFLPGAGGLTAGSEALEQGGAPGLGD
jgi:hypothetical protein